VYHVAAFTGIHCAYPRRDDQAELAWLAGYLLTWWFTNLQMLTRQSTSGDGIAKWSACSTNDREVGVLVLLVAGCRVATVGQLFFAPWAWAYSVLHPFMVSK